MKACPLNTTPRIERRADRRDLLAALAASTLGAVACAQTPQAQQCAPAAPASASKPAPRPRTFVLVPGGWCGGWVYADAAQLLRARGHTVYTPTLTGLADRSHLLNASVNLDTHTTDIVNLLKWEELNDVVLVGHSFSGPVLAQVAEKVLPQIGSMVFVNAYVPSNGQSITDLFTARGRDGVLARVAKGEIGDPAPPAPFFVVDQPWWARLDAKHTPQPLGVYTQKAVLTGALLKVPKRTYVLGARFARGRDYDTLFFSKYKTDPAWRTVEMDSGHLPMLDQPTAFVQVLEDAA